MSAAEREGGVRVLASCAGLLGLTVVAFQGATENGFVYDDGVYILDNTAIHGGLALSTIKWALRSFYAANWHPVTWLSHALDIELYKLNPIGHHLTSVLIHALNAVLLMLALRAMTGSLWRSVAAAALFATHPLRVESVAWISERKDVLCGLFWMLTILAYVWYSRSPSAARYTVVVFFFGMGIAAKPMMVTLPIVLILLDYWPLGRSAERPVQERARGIFRILGEKGLLIGMSMAACAVTLLAQSQWGSVVGIKEFPLGVRAANAAVAYVVYIRKFLWPNNLAVHYPHPGYGLPTWQVAASAVALVVVTFLATRMRASRPYVFVGWMWYLVTLVPVIGLVQVGTQAIADRYTYIPTIGLTICLLWWIQEPAARAARWVIAILGVALVGGLTLQTRSEVEHWRDDVALFSRAVQVTSGNAAAHYALSRAYGVKGDYDRAVHHARKALQINPVDPDARIGLGVALTKSGRHGAAIREFKRVIECDPRNVLARVNLAVAYESCGRHAEARSSLWQAMRFGPAETMQIVEKFRLQEQWPSLGTCLQLPRKRGG